MAELRERKLKNEVTSSGLEFNEDRGSKLLPTNDQSSGDAAKAQLNSYRDDKFHIIHSKNRSIDDQLKDKKYATEYQNKFIISESRLKLTEITTKPQIVSPKNLAKLKINSPSNKDLVLLLDEKQLKDLHPINTPNFYDLNPNGRQSIQVVRD